MLPVIALLALQVFGGREAVDPTTYVSRSGAYELLVDASRIDGSGDGSYRMLHGGREAWSGVKDFTLLDARVADDGSVFGYALTQGRRRLGELRVVVLAPDGSVQVDDRHAREGSRFPDSVPNPHPLDLLLLSSADAGVLRVLDPDLNRGLESWLVYRISSGERLESRLPAERLGGAEDPRYKIQGARALEPQGLVLAFGWIAHGAGVGSWDEQWFALVEPAGEVVWKLEDPRAFHAKLGGVTTYDLADRVRQRGLLSAPDGSDMRLWRVAGGAAVDYRVERDSAAEHGWRVVEVERAPDDGLQVVPSGKRPEAAKPLELAQVAAIPLERGSEPSAPELGPIAAWAFDEAGGMRVVRRVDRDRFEHLRLDSKGSITSSKEFDVVPETVQAKLAWIHLALDRWLATVSPYGDNASARAFFADGASGALEPLMPFRSPAVDAVAAAPDGGFAVLATHSLGSARARVLIAFAPDGKERWRIEEQPYVEEDSAALFSPEDLTVTPSGSVVVLDNIRNTLQVFDSGGAFERAVDLEDAWGRKPRYLAGVRCAPLGGFLVYDFNGAPPLVVLESDGTIRSELRARRADGHTSHELAREARYAPDGTLWTSDGHRFYRLDDSGAEVEALGEAPSPDFVHDPGARAIDVLGRVAVQDRRTGAIHVFGCDGRKLATCRPDPTDFERFDTLARIVADPDEGFLIEIKRKGHVRFDAQGKRLERLSEANPLDYLPGSEVSFTLGRSRFHGVEVRGESGVVARVERLPSKRWITLPDDVFAFSDGSFALLSDGEVGIYDADGTPRVSHRMAHAWSYESTVSASQRWILVSGFESQAWLIDRESGAEHWVAAPGILESSSCAWALSPAGDEILVLDVQALVLHRYAVP